MKSALFKGLGVLTLMVMGVGSSLAQGWFFVCIDPLNTAPYTIPYGLQGQENDLILVTMGVVGTVTWGGANGPCFAPGAQTLDVVGRFAFGSGQRGSVQGPNNGSFDDFMAWTTGWPNDPAFVHAIMTRDGNHTRFGSTGWTFVFDGESDRYFRARTTLDNTRVDLIVDVLGDAARFEWIFLNNDTTTSHNYGLWFGGWAGMIANQFDPNTGEFASGAQNLVGGKPGYVMPGNSGRPPRTDQRYQRDIDPANFPQVVDFLFGQSAAFGFRLENGPTPATSDPFGVSDATDATEFALGNWVFLLGGVNPGDFPDLTVEDLYFLSTPCWIQKFPEQNVAAGSFRTLVHYVRSAWAESNYTPPYCVVLDAPKLLAYDPNGQNDLTPNPFTIRVYIDNVAGFSAVNQEVPLADVKVKITLPPGVTLEPGEVDEKIITSIPARVLDFVDFQCRADGQALGALPYTVRVHPVPGPIKTLTSTIQVSSTPRLVIRAGANLLTTPWIFSDSSWETVLQLVRPAQFQAFNWDPSQQGYVISTSAERGKGSWIVSTADHGSRALGGNPQEPQDSRTIDGAAAIQLRSGWNLIGNPYPYAFPLGHIVGVTGAINQQSFTWHQLVTQGIISGALAYWDVDTQSYKFIQGNDALMQPNVGYWIFVATVQDFTLKWPPIYAPFLPNVPFRSKWTQTDGQWRLQIVGRNNHTVDDQNYLGRAKNADAVRAQRWYEAPMAPTQQVSVSIKETVDGQPAQLAQSLREGAGRKEWKVVVRATEPGSVTITWPNMATVPKNTRFRLVDLSNSLTRNMRQSSGYTFDMSQPGTREFTITSEPGSGGAAVIGNVTISRPGGRSPNDPFTINYTLSSAATTNVRILSGSGKEVYVAARGRADRQGQNSVTWTTRDSAGRSVAPGIYRVEIIAETEDGQRVRKIIPLNVIR